MYPCLIPTDLTFLRGRLASPDHPLKASLAQASASQLPSAATQPSTSSPLPGHQPALTRDIHFRPVIARTTGLWPDLVGASEQRVGASHRIICHQSYTCELSQSLISRPRRSASAGSVREETFVGCDILDAPAQPASALLPCRPEKRVTVRKDLLIPSTPIGNS